jgi:hypothetical protein
MVLMGTLVMAQPPTADVQGCRLEISEAKVVGQALHLTYAVVNRGREPVYLFNRLYHKVLEGGAFQTDVNLVYVETAGDKVTLGKKIVPVPADKDVEMVTVPCVTRVGPGQRFTETLNIALPVSPSTPYFHPPADALGPPVARPADFEVGFFVAAPGTDALAKTVKVSDGTALYFHPFPESRQSVVRATLPVAIPVRPVRR